MKRVALVVDGLNLYHSIERHPHLHGCKWLNLKALANAFIKTSQEIVTDVCFCTSSPTWNLNKLNRHNALLKVYEDLGIRILKGEIRETKKKCGASCRQDFKVYEEKQTDSNVAIEVIKHGLSAECDKVFLLTADSDQIPTVRFFRERFSAKDLVVVIPYGEYGTNLRSAAAESMQITLKQLKNSVLDEPYKMKTGQSVLKPETWCAPRCPI